MPKKKETLSPIPHEIRTLKRRIERNQKKVDEIMREAREGSATIRRAIAKDSTILIALEKSA